MCCIFGNFVHQHCIQTEIKHLNFSSFAFSRIKLQNTRIDGFLVLIRISFHLILHAEVCRWITDTNNVSSQLENYFRKLTLPRISFSIARSDKIKKLQECGEIHRIPLLQEYHCRVSICKSCVLGLSRSPSSRNTFLPGDLRSQGL